MRSERNANQIDNLNNPELIHSLSSTPEGALREWLRDYFWKPCDGDKCLVDIDCADCMANEILAKVQSIITAKVEQAKQDTVKELLGYMSLGKLTLSKGDNYGEVEAYIIPKAKYEDLVKQLLEG